MILVVTCFIISIISLGHDNDTSLQQNSKSVPSAGANCSESLLVGKIINHKYLTQKRIGQGAFGMVYWANCTDGQNFAVKCMTE